MRLRQQEVKVLKETLYKLSSQAKLYLFGSRVDDTKKGGDINLLVVSQDFDREKLRKLRLEFFKYFGEQKLDIVVDDGKFEDPFHKLILKKAIIL